MKTLKPSFKTRPLFEAECDCGWRWADEKPAIAEAKRREHAREHYASITRLTRTQSTIWVPPR